MDDIFGEDIFNVFEKSIDNKKSKSTKKKKNVPLVAPAKPAEDDNVEVIELDTEPVSEDELPSTSTGNRKRLGKNKNEQPVKKSKKMAIKQEKKVEEPPEASPSSPESKGFSDFEDEMDHIDEDEMVDQDDQEPGTAPTEKKLSWSKMEGQLMTKLPRIEVKHIEVPDGYGCTHSVAVPEKQEYIDLHSIETPSREYPFELDGFQKVAVNCVDNYQSVLVSAHTSAGKTVVAMHAISRGLKDQQRIIYTTPIKALSNQKYQEFNEMFKEVGLITGDVTINPRASCIIMTTEILRNMLYRGSEIMREVGWVIFDEIHYMRDKERGVVWEETIILLPQKTHYVFLSATIPNAIEFAQWITYLHRQQVNVVHTEHRPVPLIHYIYPTGADGIHMVVDEHGNFKDDAFTTAMSMLKSGDNKPHGGGGGNWKKGGGEQSVQKVIKVILENDLAPVIVFSFSKKECELYALQSAKLDFNGVDDKVAVEEVWNNAIDVLSKDDQKLPQVENLLPLLKRGIGIHHGGLLPLLKETIEILFSEGLIKVLFATETFAMGLNMPAKTVLFTSMRKFDGKCVRWVTSGEYIQMSGRAGRRSLDDKGISIVMIDEKISPAAGRNIFKGSADAINSQFHLTYNMILNLLRVEEINPEYMMQRSFFQFQNYCKIPDICKKYIAASERHKKINIPNEDSVVSYYNIKNSIMEFNDQFHSWITKPEYIVPFLQSGRMVNIKTAEHDFGWGAVVNFRKQTAQGETEQVIIVDVILNVAPDSVLNTKSTKSARPPGPGEKGVMKILPVALSVVNKISQVRLYIPNDLKTEENRVVVATSIKEVLKRFKEPPGLDPRTDMKINDDTFLQLIKSLKQYDERLQAHPLHKDPKAHELVKLYEDKLQVEELKKAAKEELKKAKSLLQMDELKCRKRVLRRLGYCSDDDVISLKGRVACEITSGDELLLTEMIFSNAFSALETSKCVAVLSCVLCDERSNEFPKLSDDLTSALKMMQDMARQIAKVSKDSKLELEEEDYVNLFKPFLMQVVFQWCRGATFRSICEMTDIFEGGIIRCMRRLEELLRQMAMAARVIGNKDLEEKFGAGVKLIKRDIVFAASLYL